MKYFLIILCFTAFLSCKKDEEDPEPVTPDYADSLVGTYIGQEILYSSDNFTQLYNNSSSTLTVIKLGKNWIQVKTFNSGIMPGFTLSGDGSGNVILTPGGVTAHGSGNKYFTSAKQLNIYVKDGIPQYNKYQGTKQ